MENKESEEKRRSKRGNRDKGKGNSDGFSSVKRIRFLLLVYLVLCKGTGMKGTQEVHCSYGDRKPRDFMK